VCVRLCVRLCVCVLEIPAAKGGKFLIRFVCACACVCV